MLETIKTLSSYVGQYKKDAIVAPLLTIGEVVTETILPIVMAYIIDDGIEAGDMQAVLYYGLIMLVVALCSLAFGMAAARISSRASSGFACNLRDAMYDNIQTFSFSNIDHFSTAGLVTRMTTDVQNVQMAFQVSMRIALRVPITLIASLVACLIINAQLSIVFLVAMVFLGIALGLVMSKATPIFNDVFDRYDDLNASVQENVSGIRVVKAYVREDYETERFTKAAEAVRKLFIKAEGLLALSNPIMMIAVYGCIIALSWFGAQFISVGTLTTGELTSMFTYVTSMLMSLMMLTMIFVMSSMAFASGKRIEEVLNEKADIASPELNAATEVADGSIEFNHVSFAYGSGEKGRALEDINISIKSGETIGIVGATGSGKTTLISLISRLYDVTEGSVTVGGIDVRDYDLETLRDAVSVVLQKNTLFSGTIAENLRWGKEDATIDECRYVCQLACIDDYIEALPDGYDSRVEQGGTNFSGGQKQRLCIARALLKNPKVLVLDDSTSAVDTATDARIRRAFAENIPNTTKLIIAQRVSSVEHADRILVLDEGRVDAFDTPENLMKNNEIWREMVETQTKGGGDFDEQQY